jgi:hypothetical protein
MASLFPPNPIGGNALNAEPRAKAASDRGETARAEELSNLRLALATFALQLDSFEARLRGGRRAAGKALEIPVRRTHKGDVLRTHGDDVLRTHGDDGIQKEESEWASIKSVGSRSGT